MQPRKIYNIIADGIKAVLDNVTEEFLQKYNAMTQKKSDRLNQEIKKQFPEIFAGGSLSSAIIENELYLYRLKNYMEQCVKNGKYDLLIRLLSKLDVALKAQIELYAKMFEQKQMERRLLNDTKRSEFLSEGCLNSNAQTSRLQLLPKCSCRWTHNSRDRIGGISINNYFHYFYYVQINVLGEYTVKHWYLNDSFERAAEKGYLTIGITPLHNEAELGIAYLEAEESHFFSVEKVIGIEKLKECALGQLEYARENEVDILCYPEMLGGQEIFHALQEKLQEFPDGKGEYPVLTLCPTEWNDRKNVCRVLDRTGNNIISQQKQHPFPYIHKGIEYLENIKPDKIIHLIHCNEIGRIAILVCKDALQREYLHMLLEHLKVTLILIPSFSTGNYDFDEIIQMCRAYDCCAVWINTCSVQKLEESDNEKLERIGIVLRTGKQRAQLNNKICYFSRKDKGCSGMGGQDCSKCVYIQKL